MTGGGTSGHVLPAVAILEALGERGHRAEELKYVGSRRGVETTMMRDAAHESVFLPISGLQRSFSIRSIGRNMALSWRIPRSVFMAVRLMRRWRPKVVVSVGGYASEPIAWAARLTKVPIVCVSYDRTPGLATRRQARHAVACAVAFADTALPRAVHTGAPVRAIVRDVATTGSKDRSRQRLGIAPEGPCLAVLGGSLGSRALNDFAATLAHECGDIEGLTIVHVCGARFVDAPPVQTSKVTYVRHGYIDSIDDLYRSADLVVTRAGASTVAEIAAAGIAAVVVPWAGAADDHQRSNAAWLVDNGAAVALEDDDLTAPVAVERVRGLLLDESARRRIATRAWELGALNRSGALVELIENAAG